MDNKNARSIEEVLYEYWYVYQRFISNPHFNVNFKTVYVQGCRGDFEIFLEWIYEAVEVLV